MDRTAAVADRLIYESFLPALPVTVSRMRRRLSRALARHGVVPARRGDIVLVLAEAATNVVLHAYDDGDRGAIYANAAASGRALSVSIVDFGRGLGSPSEHTDAGYGLALMTELADDLCVCPNEPDTGTTVHATFADVGAIDCHLHSTAELERAAMMHEYSRVLEATHALRQDAEAVLAQADQALTQSRRALTQRASGAGARG